MTSAPEAALVVLITLAAVLGTSGAAKLRDPRSTRDAFVALRVPAFVPADLSARALPVVELVLAALMLLLPAGWLVPVAVAVLALMSVYSWLVARALSFDEPVACSCFGSLGRHQVDRTTVARNALLVALAATATWFALAGGSAPAAAADLNIDGWATLGAAAVAVVVAILVVGAPPASSPEHVTEGETMEYERLPIPFGVVTRHDGTTATLAELAATQARLVVVLNAQCGSCIRIAARLDAWQAELAPAVGVVAVYSSAAAADAASHAPELATWEPELNVRRVLSLSAPAAFALGADGYLAAGPEVGEDQVVEMVEAILAELKADETHPSVS